MSNDKAGPLKQPVPDFLMCQRCEDKMLPRSGYLMGGWGDWVEFRCSACGEMLFWGPDK